MDDQCVSGTSNTQCGSGGNLCDTCVAGQACTVGRCMTTNFSTGGGSTAGGSAGGSTAGGSTAGGSTGGGSAAGGAAAGGSAAGGSAGGATTGAITAPNEVWTWVDFPTSECGNGSPTGIGVNLSNRSTDVIIYMQGGGACWNSLTCYTIRSATDFDGYNGADFMGDVPSLGAAFGRTNMNNPFRNASFVFIPYCTGDVHAGDTVASYGGHHKGAANVQAYLARLSQTFPGPRRIWLTGTSAGGYGVQLNYHRFAAAFPQAEVHGLADSAQMINPNQAQLLSDWLSAWNVAEPPGCTGCIQDFNRVPAWLSTTYPNRRFGLLAYTRDNVLSGFFQMTDMEFQTATNGLLTSQYQGKANLKYYVVEPPNPTHVMLNQLFTRTVNGVPLSAWTNQWATGAPTADGGVWDNVRGP
ncbi:MAG: hypothetical protein JNJ54_32340 [Myxococcaceae bacterium]|nr:hypothetical protein [Myxococcaceae bacterium]